MALAARSKRFTVVEKLAAVEGKPKTFKFRASDAELDHYQDRLNVKGWNLETFKANPVIFFNHDDSTLPIGKGSAYVEGDVLMVDIEFDQSDAFAKQVEAKIDGGYLNAVSVRYLMKEYKGNEKGGFDSQAQELLEISVVTIPGNQRAVRVKSLETAELDALAEKVAEKLAAKAAPAPAAAPIEEKKFDVAELARLITDEARKALKKE
jgi:HK97 family phage prohead protease